MSGTGVSGGHRLPADSGPQAGPKPRRAALFTSSVTLGKFLDFSELQPFIYKMQVIRMPTS